MSILKEKRLNLEQAIAASSSCMASRVVGDRRVIVHCEQELLMIHIQRKAKMRWIADDDGGGMRYLSGLLRDSMGRYLSICPSGRLFDIDQIRRLLPLHYQTLLLPTSDDWLAIKRGDR